MPKHRERKEELSISTKLEAFYVGGNVQFTKNGQFMLCCCGEQVNIVKVDDGKVVHSVGVKESGEFLSSFLLAEDDETLITAAKIGILKQWNIKEKTLTRTWKSLHNGMVSCMAFDRASVLLATGGSDSTIKVWDIQQKYCTHNLKGASGVVSIVQFLEIESGEYVFGAADIDRRIHVWDLDTSKQTAALDGHHSTVTGLLIVQEKDKILSCSRDKIVIVWKLSSCFTEENPLLKMIPVFEAVESIFLAPQTLLSSLLSDDDGDHEEEIYFVTAGEKGVLRVWTASSVNPVFTQANSLVATPEDSAYTGQVITQAMYILALEAISVVTYEHNIVLYNVQDFELLKQFVGYNDDILDIKVMGKDNFIAVATNSPHIKVFELSTFNCQLLKGHSDIVVSLETSQSYPYMLVSGSKDNSVRVWEMDRTTKEVSCVYVGHGHTHSVTAVACFKGKSKFFLSGSEDTTLKLWTIPTKAPLVATKLNLIPQCTVIAHDKNINSVDVSVNDKLVATGSQDSTAKIWDATDLSLLGTMRGHRKGVWCVTFSPVDLVLVTSSADGTLKIWSLSDFSVLKTFDGHNASVFKVYFLSRGTQLVSCSSDGLLKLWDIKNNECMKTYDGHDDKVWALTVSSNEDFIVSGAADSNIIIWKDVTKEEKQKQLIQKEEMLLKEQDLSNFIYEKKWGQALDLALALEQPFRALNVINEILLDSKKGQSVLKETIEKMSPNQIDTLLKFTAEWNTNSKNCLPAHHVLRIILKMHSLDELLKMPERRAFVEAMLPYSERHLSRVSSLVRDAHILSFLWHNMKL